jgi:hypothetical protein
LLGVAAIVFTAVAWSQFGVGGRAALLAGFTAAALAVPPLALRRGLSATAETFAAVGLLLVLLDGYAAFYVDLFGVADYSAWGYAGAVCAVTAAVAAGYEHLTGLTGPRYVALIVAQPVLPLLVAAREPDAAGWSFTLSAVAVLNLAVVRLRRGAMTGVGITAYVFAGLAAAVAGLSGLIGLAFAETVALTVVAGAALVTAALVVLGGAVLGRIAVLQGIAGGLLVVTIGIAGSTVLAKAAGDLMPVLAVALVTGLALATAALRRVLPPAVGGGLWIGAMVTLVVPVMVVLGDVADATIRTVDAAQPFFGAALATRVEALDWQVPAVIVLVLLGWIVLLPVSWRRDLLLGAAALGALSTPAAFGLVWWSAPGLDLAVAAAALVLAVRIRSDGPAPAADPVAVPLFAFGTGSGQASGYAVAGPLLWLGGVATGLAGHAVLVGFGRPVVATVTLGVLALLGFAAAALARPGAGGVSLAVGLLAVPAAVWTATVALSAADAVQGRVTLGAAALVVAAVHLIGRRWPAYRGFAQFAALVGVAGAPLWAVAAGDSPALYAGVGLVLVATTVTVGRAGAVAAAVPLGLGMALGAGAGVLTVLLSPYGRLDRVWDGRPDGTGFGSRTGIDILPFGAAEVVAMGVLAVAVAVAAHLLRGRRAAVWSAVPVLAVAVPMALVTMDVPWPGVPGASLLLGLAGLLAVAGGLVPAGARNVVVLVSVALTGAGFAGALATRASTLVALGAVLLAGVVAGAVGRDPVARLAGWLGAVVAGPAFAFTAGRALELSLPTTAFLVLGVAAVTLALGTVLAGRRAVEGRAVQAAAYAGAVLALLLTVESARYAAAVCTLWGIVMGARALWPGERTVVRHALLVAAAGAELGGWWLLIAAERVSTPEAYTLPAAAVALLAGWLALRSRPGLTSWASFGPALAAALLPTLASVLVGEGQPVRRLLLGVGALVVVLAGTRARLQAPVVIGGGVLAVVALHELVLVWDLLPRWIPLAAAGLLLVGLAMTLERRRRDLARVRSALIRMG